MGWWRRVFSGDYRAGRGAEAAGDLVEASRFYAEAGADDALLRVVRKRAARQADPRAAAELHRQALELAGSLPADDPLAVACRVDLAEALERLRGVVEPEEALNLARQAGLLFTEAADFVRAGAAFEQAGDYERATQAYIEAGDLDGVERTAALGVDVRGPEVALVPWVEVLLDQGRVDEALDTVIEAERQNDPHAQDARWLLDAALPTAGRLVLRGPAATYRLMAADVVEIGREPGLPLVLNVPALSRRHLSIQRSGSALIVANLSTSGTVTVDGEAVLAPKVIDPPGGGGAVRIGVDGGCELLARVQGACWHVQAHIGGLGGDILVLGDHVVIGGMTLRCDGRWWQHGGATATRGQQLGPYTVA